MADQPGPGLKKRAQAAEADARRLAREVQRLKAEKQAAEAAALITAEKLRAQARDLAAQAVRMQELFRAWLASAEAQFRDLGAQVIGAAGGLQAAATHAAEGEGVQAEVEAALAQACAVSRDLEAQLQVQDVRIAEVQAKHDALQQALVQNSLLFREIHEKGVLGIGLRRRLLKGLPRGIAEWPLASVQQFVRTDAYQAAALELFSWYLNECRRQERVGLTAAYAPDLLVKAEDREPPADLVGAPVPGAGSVEPEEGVVVGPPAVSAGRAEAGSDAAMAERE